MINCFLNSLFFALNLIDFKVEYFKVSWACKVGLGLLWERVQAAGSLISLEVRRVTLPILVAVIVYPEGSVERHESIRVVIHFWTFAEETHFLKTSIRPEWKNEALLIVFDSLRFGRWPANVGVASKHSIVFRLYQCQSGTLLVAPFVESFFCKAVFLSAEEELSFRCLLAQ